MLRLPHHSVSPQIDKHLYHQLYLKAISELPPGEQRAASATLAKLFGLVEPHLPAAASAASADNGTLAVAHTLTSALQGDAGQYAAMHRQSPHPYHRRRHLTTS